MAQTELGLKTTVRLQNCRYFYVKLSTKSNEPGLFF